MVWISEGTYLSDIIDLKKNYEAQRKHDTEKYHKVRELITLSDYPLKKWERCINKEEKHAFLQKYKGCLDSKLIDLEQFRLEA